MQEPAIDCVAVDVNGFSPSVSVLRNKCNEVCESFFFTGFYQILFIMEIWVFKNGIGK